MGILVRSEIKSLKQVLVHRPGEEIQNLTPDSLDRLLFDDIPYLREAQKEHDVFTDILRNNGVEVVYLDELVTDILKDMKIKNEFLRQYIEEAEVFDKEIEEILYKFFDDIIDIKGLTLKLIAGVRKDEINLPEKGLVQKIVKSDEYPFIIDPMPNLYFTRDPFASIGDKVSIHKMYSVTRSRETIFAEYIFKYHPRFKNTTKLYDRHYKYHIEGGDIINLSDEVIAIGISQRTQPEAIEEMANEIFYGTEGNKINTILAFDIPNDSKCIHLDTVFTQVDYNKFTIYSKVQEELDIYEITKDDKEHEIKVQKANRKLKDILSKHLGIEEVILIPCGGENDVASDREQANDGSNTLCIKPGEVIVYSRNYETNKVLEEHGIKLHIIPSGELSRGGGGPRCMSMPLVREE